MVAPSQTPGTRPNRPAHTQDGPQQANNAQNPTPPGAPGGGSLTNSLFSGDHVLERVARGEALLKHGAKGPAVRAIQQFLLNQGFDLGRHGADGHWGGKTTTAVKAWQRGASLGADGKIGKNTLGAMDSGITVTPPPARPTTPQASSGPADGDSQIPADFEEMWDAHPHNNSSGTDQNTSSSEVNEDQGWDPDRYANTCAVRLSVMFNELGGNFKLTRDKAKAAGLDPRRLPYSKKTGWYYILSAREMWTYVEHWGGSPDEQWPASGRYKDNSAYRKDFDDKIKPEIEGKKGIVAFDKIFSYSGTGHVDIFNGMSLSAASSWYACKKLKVWYV
ncbi:MAG TPA: hypothetical protein DCQ06_08725 [Myxococcales bacterium]|mgnify:CR=1 FL=1|nr:hypothetical protein [Myxococcales bacterium]HAN31665.1 hypothetical protein [Myxococcales bacterium]